MTLEERIEQLEKQNRRRKRTSILLGVCAAAALGMAGADAGPRTVEADKVLIKDPAGHIRIILGMGKNGPELLFRNADGKPQAMLRSGAKGPTLVLQDTGNGRRASLSVTKSLWGLRVSDARGRTRAEVSASGSGQRIIQQNTIIR